jgi:hypothetical protein
MGEEEKSYSHERKPKFLEVNEDRRKTTGWALVGLDGPAQFGPLLFFFSFQSYMLPKEFKIQLKYVIKI